MQMDPELNPDRTKGASQSESIRRLNSESDCSSSPAPNSPSMEAIQTLSNNLPLDRQRDSAISNMSSTLGSSGNYRLSPTVPDTTSMIISPRQEHGMSAASSSSSSSSQQISKMKSGLSVSSVNSLPSSVNVSRPLSAVSVSGQSAMAPPMTMLSPFMTEYKGTGPSGTENLSFGGYIELMTLQQGGGTIGGNCLPGSTFGLLTGSQSTLQNISGSSGILPNHTTQTGSSGLTSHIGGTGGMPISINPHTLPTSHPPHYNLQGISSSTADGPRMLSTTNPLTSSQQLHVANAMFPLPTAPTALLGGKLQPPSTRPSLSHNQSSAFHQPTTAAAYATSGLLALGDPRASQNGLAVPQQMTNGAKLSLLQSADYASGTTSLSAPHPPHPHTLNQPQQQLVGNGVAGSGGGGGGGGRNGGQGNGRRSLKRSHEESMQQERSDGGVNMFPTDGGCGPIVGGAGDCRRSSTSEPLNPGPPLQQLKWQAHMVNEWHGLCDGALQDIPKIGFQVETDKGFNFSLVDDSFVCQKKNHFQVTIAVLFHRIPKFLKLKDGSIQPIERFVIDLHGVRFEQVNSCITLEQSKADRTKTKFEPEVIEVPSKPDEQIKRTICRLHFSETTQNNMRKRGKPNPDQKHFSLVVSLTAETKEGSYLVVAHVSERIIVRASNPGNFDNDCDYAWLKGNNPEIVYHHGRVGINLDKPEEALSVHGNIHLTGQVLQVSDRRVKKNITQLNPGLSQHLEKVCQLQLYEYQLDKNLSPDIPLVGASCQHERNMGSNWNNRHSFCVHEGGQEVIRDGSNTVEKGLKMEDGRGDLEAAERCHVIKTEGERRREMVRRQVGLLAQEVEQVLPNAVRVMDSTVQLSNGSRVSNLMVVDKDQILMEAIGAVQELKNIASGLQLRLSALEAAHDQSSHGYKTTNRQTFSSATMTIRNWPIRWHPALILAFLLVASFLLFLSPLVLA